MENNNLIVENLMDQGNTNLNIRMDYKKAIDCYDKVLKIYPKYIIALYNKGNAYSNL